MMRWARDIQTSEGAAVQRRLTSVISRLTSLVFALLLFSVHPASAQTRSAERIVADS